MSRFLTADEGQAVHPVGMNALRKMTRDEALRLLALSVRSQHGPGGVAADIGIAPDTVARIIQTIPLGRCPRWVMDKQRNPQTRELECSVFEVRELAGLMLGEHGSTLNESILGYFDSLDQGNHPPLLPTTGMPELHTST